MITFPHHPQTPLQQFLTDGSVVYSVGAQKLSQHLSSAAPLLRKALSHGLTTLFLLISVVGFYQLGTIASAEFGGAAQPAPLKMAPRSAAVAAPVADKPTGAGQPVAASGTAAVLAESAPTRLVIPSINVDTTFTAVGLKADGALDVPPADLVGWYTGAPTPGEIGPAIVVGHVDSPAGPAVFFDLEDLSPGDTIRITREDGQVAAFEVERLETYAQDAFPSQAVYGNIDHAGLRLITCDGEFNHLTRHYSHNLVVYARMIN